MIQTLPPPPHDPLKWVGPSQKELLEFPEPVVRNIGYALHYAQAGAKVDYAKPLKGFAGGGVLEIVEDHDGNTYRAVYTVKFDGVVYVLHCFQKKSKTGIKTSKATMDLIRRRLKAAQTDYERNLSR